MADIKLGQLLHRDTTDATTEENALPVKQSGSMESGSGLAENRPSASSVMEGYVYWSVDTDVMEYSDGTDWVVM